MSGREQIRLTRRFTLETAHTAPDGGGGFVTRWYALGVPDYPGEVYGYGTVIGTGNAVVEWRGPKQ